MTVLITGGAGFIGSRLAINLVQQRQPVVILDNFDAYYDPGLKRANIRSILDLGGQTTVVEGDIRDEALIEQIFRDRGVRAVAHLASMANVRYSIDRGRLYSDINTSATVSLLDVARRHSVEIFILSSTSSVYGSSSRIPFREDDAAVEPLAPYPASKRAAELFAHTYHHLFGLNVTVLRFFNVYGPHGRPDMMPIRAIESILDGKVIELFGAGQLKRDWTYVDDIIDGVVSALARPMGHAIINLGCGSPVSLVDFIRIYEELIGKRAVTINAATPVSEPAITYCDNTRARTLLNFEPKVTLVDGLSRTWEWYRDQRRQR
jgi:UDP-glucuronate 4-epimerase